jgi:hypothetical protein
MAEPKRSTQVSSVISQSQDPDSNFGPSKPTSDSEDPEQGIEPQSLPPNPTDWNGPNDPENPLNWPKWMRCLHVVPPAIISFTA